MNLSKFVNIVSYLVKTNTYSIKTTKLPSSMDFFFSIFSAKNPQSKNLNRFGSSAQRLEFTNCTGVHIGLFCRKCIHNFHVYFQFYDRILVIKTELWPNIPIRFRTVEIFCRLCKDVYIIWQIHPPLLSICFHTWTRCGQRTSFNWEYWNQCSMSHTTCIFHMFIRLLIHSMNPSGLAIKMKEKKIS